MFVITMRFVDKSKAPPLMEAHNQWIRDGFDDGDFVLIGSLAEGKGGTILAQGSSLEEIEARVANDPLVAEGVVTAVIDEVSAWRTDERLGFLKQVS